MTGKEAITAVKRYAKKRGATTKVVGDYAWMSERYQDGKRRGVLVRFVSAKEGRVVVWDSKKGYVTIFGEEERR